jgi:hypothetical protein
MKQRPKIWLPLGVVPLLVAAVSIEVLRHGFAWWLLAVAMPGPILAVAWMLFPYSRRARRVLLPSDASFERMSRFNDRIRGLPLLGSMLRFGDRLTNDAGAQMAREHQQWVQQQRVRQSVNDDD